MVRFDLNDDPPPQEEPENDDARQPRPQDNPLEQRRPFVPQPNDRRVPQQQQQPPVIHRPIPWCKLLTIGCLAGLCLLLQTMLVVSTWMQADRAAAAQAKMQTYLESLKQQSKDPSSSAITTESISDRASQNQPLQSRDLYVYRQQEAYSTTASAFVQRDAYWKQAISILLADWDPLVTDELMLLGSTAASTTSSVASSTTKTTATVSSSSRLLRPMGNDTALEYGLKALLQAADLGHPEAQTTLAHAMVSGIWPTTIQPTAVSDNQQDLSSSSSIPRLEIQDTLLQDNSQQTRALLLYRMAAMGGSAEASMAMAHRLEVMHAANVGSAAKATSSLSPQHEQCTERLAYYRAAADAILDQLETNPNSRAKIVPPQEKHTLYQIHLHGGSGSKLDQHNQADESAQAIQYYQVRANTGAAPHAAYTLANLHHYGLRGVEQNVTTALTYYVQAAKQGHWEAAGQAAQFYFWGIGTAQPDLYAAHRYVQLGMPWDLDGCRRRLDRKLKSGSAAAPKQGSSESTDMSLCDGNALNVMGLLLLFGLPMIVGPNAELAQGYFQLAKDQRNPDATYNLAMTKLGWKTHFQEIDELDDFGYTSANDFGSVMSDGSRWKHGLTQSEMQSVISDLMSAAGSGHVQAKHRLGMMYTEGVRLPHKTGFAQVVPMDCDRALKHFRWITDHASPQKSGRLRRAYKQFAAGDRAGSLRNYLVAAETGSDLAQLNAAFLLEQGECLGMDRIDCAKASVRLWKAAANRGQAEASLRVGDFYYYGRLRSEEMAGATVWMQYLLYPERHLSTFKSFIETWALGNKNKKGADGESEQVCRANENGDTCTAADDEAHGHTLQKDMEMAVYYYRLAADRAASPRANYNLGFMYQYGLGVKQDFHLAKRHYDMAVASTAHEAELPVSVALMCMRIHEEIVKLWMTKENWLPHSIAQLLAGILAS